jgi:Schlafen, AlbA_2
MPINDLDHLKAEIESLLENQVPEDILRDYKRELYRRSKEDNNEFLKDASSFANTAGGHILIGIAEAGGLPTEFVGVDGDLDEEVQRLESLLRDRIEPRITGIRMRPVPLANGRRVFVISIRKSWNPPHAVLHGQSRLIFVRNSAGVHQASVDEMRTLFTAGATFRDRAREFQHERLKEIHSDHGPFSNFGGEGGRMVLHIIPFSAFGSESPLEFRRIANQTLTPIWCSGYNSGYNAEGYWTMSGGNSGGGYVQVFRNGIIESAAGDVRVKQDTGLFLYARDVEDQILTKIETYMSALLNAEVLPPFFVMLAGKRMHGTILIGEPFAEIARQPLKPDLLLPAVTFENYGQIQDYRQGLKPIFDALWNAAGYRASKSYGSDGIWNRTS